MIRILVLAALTFTSAGFISCRKQHTCICTSSYDSFTMAAGVTTKAQAIQRCKDYTIIYSPEYTCSLAY